MRSNSAGLSPLARGTPGDWRACGAGRRFIPAGAGNTAAALTAFPVFPVYPRWRGEHTVALQENRPFFGLSPLARGTLAVGFLHHWRCRFIPAGAGNTLSVPACTPRAAVYPRWRGEHDALPRRKISSGGLSPLARGTLVSGIVAVRLVRFIPAGAGNTVRRR